MALDVVLVGRLALDVVLRFGAQAWQTSSRLLGPSAGSFESTEGKKHVSRGWLMSPVPVTHAAQHRFAGKAAVEHSEGHTHFAHRMRLKKRVKVPIVEGEGQGLIGDVPDTGKFDDVMQQAAAQVQRG